MQDLTLCRFPLASHQPASGTRANSSVSRSLGSRQSSSSVSQRSNSANSMAALFGAAPGSQASSRLQRFPSLRIPKEEHVNEITLDLIRTFEGLLQGKKTDKELARAIEKFDWLMMATATEEDHSAALHFLAKAANQHQQDITEMPMLTKKTQDALNGILLKAREIIDSGEAPRAFDSSDEESISLSASKSISLTETRSLKPAVDDIRRHLSFMLRMPSGTKSEIQSFIRGNKSIPYGSYVKNEFFPEKTWRVSKSFRSGSYKKIRLALDESGKEGVFTTQYISKAAQKLNILGRAVLPKEMFERSRKSTEIMHSRAYNASPESSQFVDKKGQVWTWEEYQPYTLRDTRVDYLAAEDMPAFLHLFEQMTNAVAKGHKHNLALFDIKPANLLLNKQFEVTYSDMDFAGPMDTLPEDAVLGTTGYSAPEIIFEQRSLMGPKSDIFSLALTILNMVTKAHTSVFSTDSRYQTTNDVREFNKFLAQPTKARSQPIDSPRGSLSYAYRSLSRIDEKWAAFVFERMLNPNSKDRASIVDVQSALDGVNKRLSFSATERQASLDSFIARSAMAKAGDSETQMHRNRLKAMSPTLDKK